MNLERVVDVEPELAELLDVWISSSRPTTVAAFARYVGEAIGIDEGKTIMIGREGGMSDAGVTYLVAVGRALTPRSGRAMSFNDRPVEAARAAVPYDFAECFTLAMDLGWGGTYIGNVSNIREAGQAVRDALEDRTRRAVLTFLETAEKAGRVRRLR